MPGKRGIRLDLGVGQRDLGDGCLAAEADHDVRLAVLLCGDQAIERDRGDGFVERRELGRGGDVLGLAVPPACLDEKLLRLAGHHDAVLGPDLQRSDVGILRARLGRAVFEPALEIDVFTCAGLEALAAAVLHEQGGPLQEDAALGVGQDDAPALGALHDLGVIEQWVEPKQAEPEAAAAMLRTVARPLVAAGPRQDRHDLTRKIDRHVHRGPADRDRDRLRLSAGLDRDGRRAVPDRPDNAAGDDAHLRIAARDFRGTAQVPVAAIGILAEDAEALLVARSLQCNLRWINGARTKGRGRLGDGKGRHQQQHGEGPAG